MWKSLRQKTDEMSAWYRELPEGAAAIAKYRLTEETDRRAKIDANTAAKVAHDARVPGLDAIVEKEQIGVGKAEATLTAARRRLAAAVHARQQSAGDFRTVEARSAAFLRDTAPPVIDEFISEMERTLANIRSTGLDIREERLTGTRPNIGGAFRIVRYSNYEGQVAVLAAIRAAIRVSRELHLHVATEAEAVTEITRLRAGIPFARLKEMVATNGIGDGPRAA